MMEKRKTRAELNPEIRAEHRVIYERLGRERPTLEALIASGDIDPDSITTQGDHYAFRQMVRRLKEERLRRGLTLEEVAKEMGPKMDAPALSRLERGENENPTINTVTQYARALGKRIVWDFVDATQSEGEDRR
jgi:ribosome-binding protein aMBF1 (putative translation factor)